MDYVFPIRQMNSLFWYWSELELGEEPFYPAIQTLFERVDMEPLILQLQKKCFLSESTLSRLRERVALFAKGMERGLLPKQMEGLLRPQYLDPLRGRKKTLHKVAEQQCALYLPIP